MSFDAGFIASVVVALLVAGVDDELGVDGLGAGELGDVELGDDMPDDAVELGGVEVSVDDDELLVGGVAGIDGDVLLELLVAGGVLGVASCRCWQPASAASIAAAAAVIMNRFIGAPLSSGLSEGDSVASLADLVPTLRHHRTWSL